LRLQRILALSLILFFGTSLFAEDLTSLIEESQSLSVLGESSVQVERADSHRVYGVQYSRISPQNVRLELNGENYVYDIQSDTPSFGAHFSYLPALVSLPFETGLDFEINYLTLEGRGETSLTPVQLHFVSLEPSLFVQKGVGYGLVPVVGAGYSVGVNFQRGFRDENTSVASRFPFGFLGIQFHLSQLFSSDLDWLLKLEQRNSFGGSTDQNGVSELSRTSLGVSVEI
tara:strand:- start:203 stop:889 length:687 start_codon:yes stop_codon:yes gene_type:complete